MEREALAAIKERHKHLASYEFKQAKKHALPPPLHRLSGARRHATAMMWVADDLATCFIWRDGESIERTALFGYLFRSVQGSLIPLVRMDWHPSHKGLHVLLNCETALDLTGRDLVGCKELNLSSRHTFDPRNADDRARFIAVFCETCNIRLGTGTLL